MGERLTPLRLFRVGRDWTLDDMHGLTGYSPAMFSRAERGERVFSPRARVRIARALGVKVADIFPVDEPEDDAAEDAQAPTGGRTP